MLKVNYYQVYNNGIGKLIVPDYSRKEIDRRRGLPVGAIEMPEGMPTEFRTAKELDAVRDQLEAMHLDEFQRNPPEGHGEIHEVAVMFSTVLVS